MPPHRGCSEIRLQSQEAQTECFNFLPVWFAAKAGPKSLFPASESEDDIVTVANPLSSSDKCPGSTFYLLTDFPL